MRRRDLLSAASAALMVRAPAGRYHGAAGQLLVPMDDAQAQHLKAYGLTFRVLARGGQAEWLLNYRGGSFLLPADPVVEREAALEGVGITRVTDAAITGLKADMAAGNMEVVPLEKAPEVAVYVPPGTAPWDDAVTMALEFAGIKYERIWDAEVIGARLDDYDWLHLHHEDFTGQYSKFAASYAGAPWLEEMISQNQAMARRLGYADVPAMKRAVAERIRGYVEGGGFLFAMCTATETLDLALASHATDIAAAYADGTPMAPDAERVMDWGRTLAFQDARLEASPSVSQFSDIDGHQVNSPARRQPLGAFSLFGFSARIDPVPAMLVQNHRQVIPDFYGLTTSFTRSRLKPGVTVLADEPGAPWVKYIRGELGEGTWTFYGGHDPEDPQHAIGDAPTDLGVHPNSPGYRLILNNVLFPAAKKKELKT